jgi:methionine sulfoxide reductase heme-binding subunit
MKPTMIKKFRITPLRVITHIAGWTPLLFLIHDFYTNHLTANPIQAIEQRTGLTALIFLLLSLACTPLSSILGWKELPQRRKALGDYGFMYAALHVITFVGVDYGFNFDFILRDVGKKSYILVGLAAFLMLLPLAVTSFNTLIRRLGKNWKRLHKLVYIISLLVVLHFALSVKGDIFHLRGNIRQPLVYGLVATLLLILRLPPIKKALIRVRVRLLVKLQSFVDQSPLIQKITKFN